MIDRMEPAGDDTKADDRGTPGPPSLGRRVHLIGHLWDTVVWMIAGCWLLWALVYVPGTVGDVVFLVLMGLSASLALRWLWWRLVTSRRSHDYPVDPPLFWLHRAHDD